MQLVSAMVKSYLVPGSIGFLLVGLTVGVALVLLGKRKAVWGRRGLAALAAGYWLLSLPLVSAALQGALSHGYSSLASADGLADVDAIVVLGGGSQTVRSHGSEIDLLSETAALRVLEGARLYEMLDGTQVFASGGMSVTAGAVTPESAVLCQALIQAGVPAERITTESTSDNTRQQALALAPLLAAQHVERFVLVTSPSHMRRALLAFRAVGLDAVASIALARSETLPTPPSPLLPSLRSLAVSADAFREWIGLAYYALRGWL